MHCSLMEPLPMNTVLCMRLAIYLVATVLRYSDHTPAFTVLNVRRRKRIERKEYSCRRHGNVAV